MTGSFSQAMLRAAEAGRSALLELVLPPVCRLCNAPVAGSDDFCDACQRALTASEPMMRQGCPRCGIPRPALPELPPPDEAAWGRPDLRGTDPTEPEAEQPGGSSVEVADLSEQDHRKAGHSKPDQREPDRCVHCRDRDFQFDQVAALWAYRDRVCEAVVAAKYAHRAPLADALGRRLAEVVMVRWGDALPDLVTFVPSHLTRQMHRGGNATAVMAAAVARRIGCPCRPLLKTTRPIAKQAWLDDPERLANVRGAFAAKRSYALSRTPRPRNRHILVVDDVMTTGATANEVAGVLRGSGVKRVSLAVVARAIRSR